MKNEERIIISNRILTKKKLYEEKKQLRKERAKLSFEEKIKILVDLQKLAYSWGKKKDIIIWKL